MRTDFQNELNHVYSHSVMWEELENFRVRDICGVFHEGNHFRAEVTEIVYLIGGERTYEVFLIDYGYSICVKKSQLHSLRIEHVTVYPFSFKCQLSEFKGDHDLSNTTKETLRAKFQQIAECGETLIYVEGMVHGSVDVYDVLALANDESENKFLLHESVPFLNYKHLRFDNKIAHDWFECLVNAHDWETDSQFGSRKLIEIAHIESGAEIYIRNKNNSMTEIQRLINSHVRSQRLSNIQKNYNWSRGESCLVVQQNPLVETKMLMWYRGRILENKSQTFQVFLCDYGNKIEAKASQLMSIPANLANMEDSVSFCSMDIINIPFIDRNEAKSLLRYLIKQYNQLAASYSNHTAAITLWGSDSSGEVGWKSHWDDLNVKFMSRYIRKSMQSYIEAQIFTRERHPPLQLSSDDENSSPKMSCSNDSFIEHIRRWELPLKLDRSDLYGVVTFVHPSGTIFVQVGENHKTAKMLEQSISRYIATNEKSAKNLKWQKTNACIAKSMNANYRRGIVKGIDHENGLCQVMFVDYGDKMWIRLNDIYSPINCPETINLPMLAHRFYVPELIAHGNGKEWTKDVLDKTREILIHQECQIRINIQNLDQKIIPCSIKSVTSKYDLTSWIKKKQILL